MNTDPSRSYSRRFTDDGWRFFARHESVMFGVESELDRINALPPEEFDCEDSDTWPWWEVISCDFDSEQEAQLLASVLNRGMESLTAAGYLLDAEPIGN